MIARRWKGATRAADAERYAEYLGQTGLRAFARTQGNRGWFVLRRSVGDLAEFEVISLWENRDVIRAFAGEPIDRAVFYPADEAFLVERDMTVDHWELLDGARFPIPG